MKFHPIADLFPMMSEEEMGSLVESMRANGYDPLHPIITYEDQILDGRNRYTAAQRAEVSPTFRKWETGDPWDFVWRENAVRRHLEPSQKAAIKWEFARGSETWIAEQAAARERANRARSEAQIGRPRAELIEERRVSRDTARSDETPRRNVEFLSNPATHGPELAQTIRERTKLAALAGVSPATAARVMAVQARSPEQFERVKRGEVSASKALNEIKLADKRALAEEIRANPIVTPDGRYSVIAIDPPWKYDSRAEDTTHRGKNLYPDMDVDAICAVPVVEKAQENCVLWLWTTNAFMRDAYRCLDAWGFKEKTILTWDKEIMGLGDWLRNVTEHCILAVRGRPIVSLTNQTTIIHEKRREHSRKPDAFYSLVETVCPGSRLEMFARASREGWATWGAEAEKFDAAE